MLEAAHIKLTERQKRELEYHSERARTYQYLLDQPFSWDVLERPSQRWWNAYWQMFSYLIELDLKDRQVLVVGCGFGDDALRLAKLGACVSAFDLSSESLTIGRQIAEREGLRIR
ncbi:MAG TPA: class I SAM-dependent methyltransferase, partial [Blastocatellia bacterium]|nr:class I SAM-dependent methyltransferase [Blastocatellia bacterium]